MYMYRLACRNGIVVHGYTRMKKRKIPPDNHYTMESAGLQNSDKVLQRPQLCVIIHRAIEHYPIREGEPGFLHVYI